MANQLKAQEKETYNVLIMGVPQFLVLNGIRVDIDKNIKGTNRWIVFSPEIYNGKGEGIIDVASRDFLLDKVVGAGMGCAFKYVFSKKSNAQGIYLAGGGAYQYFDIKSQGIIWSPESEGSVTLEQRIGQVHTTINKIGVHSYIGYQSKLTDEFMVDFFVGFGLRLSIDNTDQNGITDLGVFPGDYAYSGTTLVAGIRFGLGY